MMSKSRTSLLTIISLTLMACSIVRTNCQEVLLADILYEGITEGLYDAIIDVRTQEEWDETGHLPNATHIENLQFMTLPPFPNELDNGCNSGDKIIVIYCRSGSRASAAIQNLLDAGFEGTLYNGQGVSQWTDAGFDLVSTESQTPLCHSDASTFESVVIGPTIFSSIIDVLKLLITPFVSLFDNVLGVVFNLAI